MGELNFEENTSKMLSRSLPAFSNEIRLKILFTLFENKEGFTYEELRNKVKIKESNKFAYHLNKLLETPMILRYLDFKDKSRKKSLYKLSEYGKDLLFNMNELPDVYSERNLSSLYFQNIEGTDALKYSFMKNYEDLLNNYKEKEKKVIELENELKWKNEIIQSILGENFQNSWMSSPDQIDIRLNSEENESTNELVISKKGYYHGN